MLHSFFSWPPGAARSAAIALFVALILPVPATAADQPIDHQQPGDHPGIEAEISSPGIDSAAPLTETGVRDKLQGKGYDEVSQISHNAAGGWTAKAKKDGRTVTVTIGESGEVMER